MQAAADVFASLGALTFFLGLPVFVVYNRYRRRKTIGFFRAFSEQGILNRKQFESIVSEYNSFLGYATWFPDEKMYPKLYANMSFTRFRE